MEQSALPFQKKKKKLWGLPNKPSCIMQEAQLQNLRDCTHARNPHTHRQFSLEFHLMCLCQEGYSKCITSLHPWVLKETSYVLIQHRCAFITSWCSIKNYKASRFYFLRLFLAQMKRSWGCKSNTAQSSGDLNKPDLPWWYTYLKISTWNMCCMYPCAFSNLYFMQMLFLQLILLHPIQSLFSHSESNLLGKV